MNRLRGAVLLLAVALAPAATRPHYGGNLRVEIREVFETADPPQAGYSLARLLGPFAVSEWGGSRAVYTADENAPGGRPFLDSVEISMGKSAREQSFDQELGRADVIEADAEPRRGGSARAAWVSSPVRVVLLQFSARVQDARLREALALAVDRTAIHTVLLQRQGAISGALLPQWLSGYAFLFAPARDAARAKALVAALPAAARSLSFGVEDASDRRIADRIALDARDAGITLTPGARTYADVRLLTVRIDSADPQRALAALARALGLPEPARAETPEALYAAERNLLDGWRVVPLFHLPDVYVVAPRVKGGPGITPLGEWRFENLWLEAARP